MGITLVNLQAGVCNFAPSWRVLVVPGLTPVSVDPKCTLVHKSKCPGLVQQAINVQAQLVNSKRALMHSTGDPMFPQRQIFQEMHKTSRFFPSDG